MYDVIILGAGPAGLTAALYCGRSKLRTKIIDEAQPGGQLNLTDEIENFPGVPKVASRNLTASLLEQLKALPDIELTDFMRAHSLEYKQNRFIVKARSAIDEKEDGYDSKAAIIATGALPKELGIPGEKEYRGRGVSYCAVCDGPLFIDKEVVVVGGGNTALEEALFLAKFTRSVTIIHRRDQFRGVGLLQERIKENPKIKLCLDSVTVEIRGSAVVEKIGVKNVKTNKKSDIACSGVFIFVGYAPNTSFIKGFVAMDDDKFIITDDTMMTSVKGLFACGDCRKRPFKQVVTACGEGAVAAHMAEQYITEGAR